MLFIHDIDKYQQNLCYNFVVIGNLQQLLPGKSDLTTYERRKSLLDMLKKQPGLRVTEIALEMEVSEGTVRNDLNALEDEGYLTRVHGGAVLSPSKQPLHPAFSIRHQANAYEKECIAKHASKMINNGDSILLDASSTVYYLALNLQEHNRLRVVTNGIEVARLLAQHCDLVGRCRQSRRLVYDWAAE